MTDIPEPIRSTSWDIAWLRRFWLASALMLAATAALALVGSMVTRTPSFAGGALVLASFGVWLTLTRRRTGRGHVARYVILAGLGQYVFMVTLLPLIPELATTIVPAALIPVFLATPFLGRKGLDHYSIAVWGFCVAYAIIAVLFVATSGVSPQRLATLVAQLLGVVSIVAFILALLRRYAEAHGDAHQLALHDSLTGLANRALFVDRLEHAIERSRRRGTMTAVLYLDLDGFKAINDRHGHGCGDEVLRSVAERISETTRASDTTARVGGDEFAVLLEDIDEPSDADALTGRLRDALADPIESPDGNVPMRVSMGIAFSGESGETPEALLRSADDAMYESKRQGLGALVVHRPALRIASAERRSIKRAFRGVVERDELRIQYQPLVRIHSRHRDGDGSRPGPGTILGVEALLRWDDPDRGWRMPAQFIGLAEETGDIVPIGRWVLREAARQIAMWRRSTGRERLWVSVNVSGRQLRESSFEDELTEVLDDSGLTPDALILEVSEEARVHDSPVAMEMLQRFHALGVQLAIDDFGTGYSSLGSLKDFRVDLLKLDRSLLNHAIGSDADTALLRAAVDLGAALDAEVVGEGIETPEELALLRSLGCDVGQGFLLAPPLDPSAVERLLHAASKPWADLLSDDPSKSEGGGTLAADGELAGTVRQHVRPSLSTS